MPLAEDRHQVVGVLPSEARLELGAGRHRVLGARGVAEQPALERVAALELVARVPVRAGGRLMLALVPRTTAEEDRRAVVRTRQDHGHVARLDAGGRTAAE